MKIERYKWLTVGVLVGYLLAPRPVMAGNSIWESAQRMAVALERIANVMEK